MFSAIDIATSGLVAQRVRMNVSAANLANIDSFTPDGKPYKRRSVIFEVGRNGADKSGQGVHVAAIEKQDVYRMEYDPGHPFADKNGYVKKPGIDQFTETLNAMEAQRAYEANITAIDVTKAMLNSSLRILA